MIETLLLAAAFALGSPEGENAGIQCLGPRDFQAAESEAFGVTDPSGATAAFAWTGHTRVVMRRGHCRVLANPNAYPHRKVAKSALVFAHELAHTRGVKDEHLASCQGVKQTKRLAKLLGYRKPFALRRTAEWLASWWLAGTHTCRMR